MEQRFGHAFFSDIMFKIASITVLILDEYEPIFIPTRVVTHNVAVIKCSVCVDLISNDSPEVKISYTKIKHYKKNIIVTKNYITYSYNNYLRKEHITLFKIFIH